MIRTASIVFALVLVACGTAPSETPSQESAALHAPAPELDGTWTFDLDRSDPAGALRATCEGKGDACWDAVRREARQEKIRFRKGKTGYVWTSLAEEKPGAETVFLEVPVELAPDGPGRVLATIAGKPTGQHAARFEGSSMKTLAIEVVDGRTIALKDPEKGRLVFSKE